ncbi:MAG: transposase [Gammaproteobacteria bacterium]|nr:transposase [Gammaproteobacteria bacterium]
MPRYTDEFKEQVVRKMMPPNAMSVAELSREIGISGATLYNWRNKYRKEGKAVPADPSNPERWSGENKLAVLIESAALNEQELSEYCRRKGLYVEQILRWKEAAIAGNESGERLTKAERQALKKERSKSRRLEKELNRKEKALAEIAALLVLKKKAQAIWGEDEDV